MIEINEQKEDNYTATLKVIKKKDVVVVGAGPAGCLATLSARRAGADVLLIERESYLGGMMTGGLVNILNAFRSSTEGNPLVVKGISLKSSRGYWQPEEPIPGQERVRYCRTTAR